MQIGISGSGGFTLQEGADDGFIIEVAQPELTQVVLDAEAAMALARRLNAQMAAMLRRKRSEEGKKTAPRGTA